MFTRSVLILAGLLALAGCTEKPVGSAIMQVLRFPVR